MLVKMQLYQLKKIIDVQNDVITYYTANLVFKAKVQSFESNWHNGTILVGFFLMKTTTM